MPGNTDTVKRECLWLQAHFNVRNEAHITLQDLQDLERVIWYFLSECSCMQWQFFR